MIPKTIKELFDQIQIDADNHVIFNRELYENECNKITYRFARWYYNKIDLGEFGRYSFPINNKKKNEFIKDLIDVFANEMMETKNKP